MLSCALLLTWLGSWVTRLLSTNLLFLLCFETLYLLSCVEDQMDDFPLWITLFWAMTWSPTKLEHFDRVSFSLVSPWKPFRFERQPLWAMACIARLINKLAFIHVSL
ncbi:hypothetical protein BJ912DRAFT_561611 [Pholiota molesta]|nr:hypothetical protein BJ912DRAFT_561611 [Pholiota molesta]